MEDTLNMSPPTMDESTSKAVSMSTEIMIVAIVVFCFVIGLCFFLNMYARWFWVYNNEDPNILSWRRRVARSSAAASHRHRRRGLDLAAIRSLPAVVYKPKDFKEGLECSVCLSEVTEGEKTRLLPKCNHGFHLECIDMWFQSHSTCPLCRNSVISDDDDSNVEVQNDGGGGGGGGGGGYFSDSSESDDEHNHDDDDGSYGSPRVTELPVFPTNVLYWGNETQVRSLGQADHDDGDDASPSSSSSSDGGRARNGDEVVIEMPPPPGPPQVEPKTPVMTRLRSLKRLLSLGKRVAVAPYPNHGSTSCDVDQSQQV